MKKRWTISRDPWIPPECVGHWDILGITKDAIGEYGCPEYDGYFTAYSEESAKWLCGLLNQQEK